MVKLMYLDNYGDPIEEQWYSHVNSEGSFIRVSKKRNGRFNASDGCGSHNYQITESNARNLIPIDVSKVDDSIARRGNEIRDLTNVLEHLKAHRALDEKKTLKRKGKR